MQQTLIIGSTLRCADGTAGNIVGLIINPNRSHVDYVIFDIAGPGGREYFVPSSQLGGAGANTPTLSCTSAGLDQFPHPEERAEQGTVQDNLSDLIVAREQTPVRDAQGSRIGLFHGAVVDTNLEVQAILLDRAPDQAVPIAQMARDSENPSEVVVHLAHEMAA